MGKTTIYTLVYLIPIIGANLLTARFGASISILNAFLFIGLDLTCRDALHDAWGGKWLWPKMLTLIAVGSLLSWFLNHNAGRIALASFMAFAAAGIIDAVVYQILHKKPWMARVNGSNVVSSATDSLIFPTIAFGGFTLWVTLGQFAAKVIGGFAWAVVLRRKNAAAAATHNA